MISQSGKQTIAIHILSNICRSKGNQKMKLGQLIEYNMKNIFLEKSCTKCGWYILWTDKISLSGCLSEILDMYAVIIC